MTCSNFSHLIIGLKSIFNFCKKNAKIEFKLANQVILHYYLIMLIQFSARNFKSFKDSFSLDLFSNKSSSVSSLYSECGSTLYPSAIFYGANGSGKSNVLKAFEMMQRLVLNKDKIIQSTDMMPINQFRLSTESEDDTSAFDICFTFKGKKYKYGFEYGIENERSIVYSEYLYVYETVQPTIVFEYDLDENEGKIRITKYKELEKIRHLENSLFLWEADRFSNEVAADVLQWFKSAHYVEYSSRMSISPRYWELLERPETQKAFQIFMHDADFGINDIFQDSQTVKNPHVHIPNLPDNATVEELSVKTLHSKYNELNNQIGEIKFNLFEDESFGTQKYFYVIGPIIDTLKKGTVLFLDELDASLHPILTRRIVELFNNKESNPKGAQLIFTSQDTNLLDQKLFDKEQIWFIEKDKFGCSHFTSLSEYKDIRKQEKIEQKYIMGKYGAIPYLGDFKFWDE